MKRINKRIEIKIKKKKENRITMRKVLISIGFGVGLILALIQLNIVNFNVELLAGLVFSIIVYIIQRIMIKIHDKEDTQAPIQYTPSSFSSSSYTSTPSSATDRLADAEERRAEAEERVAHAMESDPYISPFPRDSFTRNRDNDS
jgi:hypothetical protein